MIEDHSDSERENLLPSLHGLFFPITSKGSFITIIPQRIAHTTHIARGNLLPPLHGLLFLISSKGSFKACDTNLDI